MNRNIPRNLRPLNPGGGRILTALLLSFLAAGSARAHVTNHIVDCLTCHTGTRNGVTLTGNQTTTNLNQGLGVLKVFQAAPGDVVAIGLNVTDGHDQYALALSNLGVGGAANTNHHLQFQADPAWLYYTLYYAVGPNTANQAWTFNLKVLTNTPPDFYQLNLRMAGKTSAGKFGHLEKFYIQVVAPPTVTAPTLTGPVFTNKTFSVSFATDNGFTYYLDYKPALTNTVWTEANHIAGNGAVRTLTDPGALDVERFYHLRVTNP